jgi:ABC-type anion transport system duplicated permease subunit
LSWKRSAQEHLRTRVLLLTGAIALAAVAATPVGFALSGRVGVVCVWLAAAVCWLPGALALAIQEKCRDPRLMLLHVLAGFIGRLAFPLAACIIVYLRGGPLVEAGFAVYLLGLYFVALAVGTLLDLSQHGSDRVQGMESPH